MPFVIVFLAILGALALAMALGLYFIAPRDIAEEMIGPATVRWQPLPQEKVTIRPRPIAVKPALFIWRYVIAGLLFACVILLWIAVGEQAPEKRGGKAVPRGEAAGLTLGRASP